MCPVCMASAALMAGSVMSTGGVAAIVVKMVRSKKSEQKDGSKNVTERKSDYGNHDEQDGTGNGRTAS